MNMSARNAVFEVPTILGGYLDSVDMFVVKGWGMRKDGKECRIKVIVNGAEVECPIVRVERKDVENEFHVDASNAGFEIYLPGYLWEFRVASGDCVLEVMIEDELIKPGVVILTENTVIDWLEKLRGEGRRSTGEHLELLALEHVKFSGLYAALQEPLKDYVGGLLEKFHLDGYLECDDAQEDSAEVQFETVSEIILRDAMLELNSLLGDSGSEIYSLIRQVYRKYSLRGTAREWYINLAVQLTCGSGEFDCLKELTEFRYLEPLCSSQQPHQLALLVPVLVSKGEVDKSSEIVRLIGKYVDNSWLPTACIAYSEKVVRRLEMEGRIEIQVAERFRLAVVTLLDGFKAGWFSRLHDRALVETMVSMLADCEFYTDYHKRDLVAAALRHYGLSPEFWGLIDLKLGVAATRELSFAREAWEKIEKLFARMPSPSAGVLVDGLESMELFQTLGNREAPVFIMEAILNCSGEDELSSICDSAMQRLLAYEDTDLVRFAAHPSSELVSGKKDVKRIAQETLRVSRWLGGYHKSAVYDLQFDIANSLEKMRKNLGQPEGCDTQRLVKEAFVELERKSMCLGTWQGMFLGADMMFSAYHLSPGSEHWQSSLLMSAIELIRKAVNACGDGHDLPAPICALIGRIGILGDVQEAKSFLKEIRNMLRVRFGKRYDRLFIAQSETRQSAARHGWPHDTLVIIHTSRETLQDAGASIRSSWVKDLDVRGIPYLFVVGGGDDVLKDDVLELDVSDDDRDQARKRLKAYGWAIENTDAQYIVMTGDKVAVDVRRYFNSMSYRKYHCYGLVVRSSQAKIDRQWCKDKCTNDVQQKSLDKSSAETSFLVMAYSCSLSRFAIMELLDASATDEGKRVMARSYSADKVIGDLLSMKNLAMSDEDFDVYSDGGVICDLMSNELHGNAFHPGPLAPGKIAYCTDPSLISEIRNKRDAWEIWPKKIWPSYQKVSINSNSNQLILKTDKDAVKKLLLEDVVVVAVVRNEMVMLRHFLSHYRGLGVKCFIFVDNGSGDGTREYLMSQPDTIVYSADTEYRHSHYGVAWQQAVLSNHCVGKWVLLADADEFLVYEGCETIKLSDFVDDVERKGDNGVLLYMIDMYPYGDLAEARFDQNDVFEVAPYFDRDPLIELRFGGGMYSNSRNFVNGLRHRIAPSRINAYVSQKYALFRYFPWVRLCEGVHYAANIKAELSRGFFAHFKYHSGFKDKVALEVKRKQHFNGAEEYKKYAGMMAEVSGGFGVDGVSERYIDSGSFVRLLKQLG